MADIAQPFDGAGASFLSRLAALGFPKEPTDIPQADVASALKPSLDFEATLRKLYAQDKTNPIIAGKPNVGLIDIFGAGTLAPNASESSKYNAKTGAGPPSAFQIRRRAVDVDDIMGSTDPNTPKNSVPGGPRSDGGTKMDAKYVLPLPPKGRLPHGSDALASGGLAGFLYRFGVFSEGSLNTMTKDDWKGVFVAGGAVMAALLPLPHDATKSRRALRKHYHESAFPSSDIDLFLYGMTHEEAVKKMERIYEAISDALPWDTTCIRTRYAVSIICQYPYRTIQIVLRLYSSPAEIVTGFDLDTCAVGFDGSRVWASPRAIAALITQSNRVDITRRSPSYESRLVKYAVRGFEVYVPDLVRAEIDPTIYERTPRSVNGLARLLVLEKIQTSTARDEFMQARRHARSRPGENQYQQRRRWTARAQEYKGDLKGGEEIGIATSSYDRGFHIPYGAGWTAERIAKIVYQKDLVKHSKWNPSNKGRRLHRHPAFFGIMTECMEDCCGHCPTPINDEEREIAEAEKDDYVQGPITFIEEDPGRQSMSGSFNPMDEGDYKEEAYLSPEDKTMAAIVSGDIPALQALLASEPAPDLKRRDAVGRSPLHMAVLCGQTEVANILIDAGARVSARLVDGRTPLHMAAHAGNGPLLQKLFERSDKNKEEAEKEAAQKGTTEVKNTLANLKVTEDDDADLIEVDEAASEDIGSQDTSMHDEEGGDAVVVTKRGQKQQTAEEPEVVGVPEDSEDEPDVLDPNAPDWDLGLFPIHYAVMSASIEAIDVILKAGGDARKASKPQVTGQVGIVPLLCALLIDDDVAAIAILRKLIASGASASQVDSGLTSVLMRYINNNRPLLVQTLLTEDPKAASALGFPMFTEQGQSLTLPFTSAVAASNFTIATMLLAHGCKTELSPADIDRWAHLPVVQNTAKKGTKWGALGRSVDNPKEQIRVATALETALLHTSPATDLILSLPDVSVSFGMRSALEHSWNANNRHSAIDWVQKSIKEIGEEMEKNKPSIEAPKVTWWLPDPPVDVNPSRPKTFAEAFHADVRERAIIDSVHAKAMDKDKKIATDPEFDSAAYRGNYLKEIAATLEAKGSLTWNDLPTTKDDQKNEGEVMQRLRRNRVKETEDPATWQHRVSNAKPRFFSLEPSGSQVAEHKEHAYLALFEAAFRGDSSELRALTLPLSSERLPPDVIKEVGLLKIAVYVCEGDAPKYRHFTDSSSKTPFWVACEQGQWEAAATILDIAQQQYNPAVKIGPKGYVVGAGANSSDDEDEDDRDEDEDDLLLEEHDDEDGEAGDLESDLWNPVTSEHANMTTILLKPSWFVLRDDLKTRLRYRSPRDHNRGEPEPLMRGNIIDKLMMEGNVDAVKRIMAMVDKLDSNYLFSYESLRLALRLDNPDLLSAVISFSGLGIESMMRGDEGYVPNKTDGDEPDFYMGLNINGQKKIDLARKADPNHENNQFRGPEIPLLYAAARSEAVKCIRFLVDNKFENVRELFQSARTRLQAKVDAEIKRAAVPSSDKEMSEVTHKWRKSDEFRRLQVLNRLDLNRGSKDMQRALGAVPDALDETVIREALFFLPKGKDGSLPAIQTFLEVLPNAKSFLSLRSRRDGRTPLLMSISPGNVDLKIFDYLLKEGSHPLEQDQKGQNILHLAYSNMDHLKHALGVLPGNVIDQLLVQTNSDGNTPLHSAVSQGSHEAVPLLLTGSQASTSTLYMRNYAGNTPLATATAANSVTIAKAILEAALRQGVSDILDLEDGVGSKPEETVNRTILFEATGRQSGGGRHRWNATCPWEYSMSLDSVNKRGGCMLFAPDLSSQSEAADVSRRENEFSISHMESEIASLRLLLEGSTSGYPKLPAPLRPSVQKLLENLEKLYKLRKPKTVEDVAPKKLISARALSKLFQDIRRSASNLTASRKLVHMRYVQRSIKVDLDEVDRARWDKVVEEAKEKKDDALTFVPGHLWGQEPPCL